VDAAILENFKSSNHGLSFTRFGFCASRGLKFILGSWLLGEPLNHEERSKHCENQNGYQVLYPPPFCFGHLFGIVAATNLFFWTVLCTPDASQTGHHRVPHRIAHGSRFNSSKSCVTAAVAWMMSTPPPWIVGSSRRMSLTINSYWVSVGRMTQI
jgi:hypothetical protein